MEDKEKIKFIEEWQIIAPDMSNKDFSGKYVKRLFEASWKKSASLKTKEIFTDLDNLIFDVNTKKVNYMDYLKIKKKHMR